MIYQKRYVGGLAIFVRHWKRDGDVPLVREEHLQPTPRALSDETVHMEASVALLPKTLWSPRFQP